MKKLLVSCDEYAYQCNGNYYLREFGITLVHRYLNVFDKVRFVVRTKVVDSETKLDMYNIPIDDRVEIFPVPFFQGPKEYANKYFRIKKILKNCGEGCDAAIFRIPSTLGFAVLKKIRQLKIPYAVEVIANPLISAMNEKNIVIRTLMRIIHYQQLTACKNADGVSYVTKNTLQKIYPATKKGHFESYYSSVEIPEWFYSQPRKYIEKKPFVICHVSNPIKTFTKGHTTVIETVKLLTEKGYDVEARFAGEGEMVSYFKEYSKKLKIENKIKFIGLLNQWQLKNLLDESDLMLFPSFSEGLPRVIIEAMATSLPCLSTPVGGIPELLNNELLYNPNDSLGFTKKISEIIDNPSLYNKLSENAYLKAMEFKSDLLQKHRIEFYKKLKEMS